MNFRKRKVGLVIIVIIASAILITKRMGKEVSWTILIYMNGNNDLHLNALKDFIEIKNAETNSKVKVLVQLSRQNDVHRMKCGNWSGTKRFEIEKGIFPFPKNELSGENTPINQKMDNPEALIEFINWGQNYSETDKYGLIFWDHGKLLKGTMAFDYPPKDQISMSGELLVDVNQQNEYLDYVEYQEQYNIEINELQGIEKKSTDEKLSILDNNLDNLYIQSNSIFDNLKKNSPNPFHFDFDKIDNQNYSQILEILNSLDINSKEQRELNEILEDINDGENTKKITVEDGICIQEMLMSSTLNIISQEDFERLKKEEINNNNPNDLWSVVDAKAIKKGLNDQSIKKFEFIAFDSCRMAYIEIIDKLSELTDNILASQVNIKGNGLEYTSLLNSISQKEVLKDTDLVVKHILNNYKNSYKHHITDRNYSIINLVNYDKFKVLFSKWTTEYQSYLTSSEPRFKPYRICSTSKRLNEDNAVDLFDFLEKFEMRFTNIKNKPNVYKTTVELIKYKDVLVGNNQFQTNKNENTNGINIYFPYDSKNRRSADPDYKKLYSFGQNTNWINLLPPNN